ncbi:MAG: hypothetical protein ACI8W8_003928, partial [Rhodothermales bacterium]
MKSRLCLFIALIFAAAVHAQELNTLTDQEKADGWKLLFDGKTLTGWNSWKTKKQVVAGKWTVTDGALSLGGKGGGDLYTA